MTKSAAQKLSRDRAEREPLHGNTKVTREDWLRLALEVLIRDGVGELKILTLSEKLGVSRSSFYWYFQNRAELLAALIEQWNQRTTEMLLLYCEKPADDVTHAVCHFFQCFMDPAGFDRGLDFAVREWARRDDAVRLKIDAADRARLDAVNALFRRFGYAEGDAETRSRILYYMQIGYHALGVREPLALRLELLEGYLIGFTGHEPNEKAVAAFKAFATALDEPD